jgi:hypothetical protein
MSTEREVLDLLLARYNTDRSGAVADRWVRAEHVQSSQSFGREQIRIADFLAIDKWQSSHAIYGHEVKVSRADWLSELRDPSKAQAIMRFCTYWYLVVPTASIVKPGELPAGWGLMVQAGSRLRIRHKAPELTPEPLTLDFTASLVHAVQRTACREPLHRDARTFTTWTEKGGTIRRCQACGETSPCQLHQPRLTRKEAA